jgi:hypothetical protein
MVPTKVREIPRIHMVRLTQERPMMRLESALDGLIPLNFEIPNQVLSPLGYKRDGGWERS